MNILKTKFKYACYWAFTMAFLFCLFGQANAATCTWNSAYGDWNDPANWSPAGIPSAVDDIVIDNGGKVLVNVAVTVASINLSNGSISGTENMIVSGNFDWSGGSVSATVAGSSLTVQGILTISDAGDKSLTDRNLILTGSGSWTAGNVNVSTGTTFTIATGSSFNFDLAATYNFGSTAGCIIDLQGTLNKIQTTTANYIGQLNVNGGTLNVNAGTLNAFTSSSGTHTGVINISAGAVYQFTSGTHNFNTSSVSGAGKIIIAGGAVNFNASNLATPDIEINSGTLTDNGGLTVSNVTHTAGTYSGTNTTTVTGIYTWSGGSISGTGTTTADSMLLSGSTKTLTDRTFSLTGHGDWTDGDLRTSSGGTFQVAGGSVFNINHAGNHNFGHASDGIIDLHGTINKITSGRTTIKSQMNSAGTAIFNLVAGTLRAFTSSSGNHAGSFILSNGATFQLRDGTHNFNNSSNVSGAGIFLVRSSANVNINAGANLTCNVEVIGGELKDDLGFTPSSFTQSAGIFTGTGSGICTGDMNWSGGTISGSNTFSVTGTANFSGTTRTLDAKKIKLNASGDWQTGNFAFLNDGTLEVGVAGTLLLNHTLDQSATGTGKLSIYGTMSKRISTSITTIEIATENDGTVEGVGSISCTTLTNRGIFAPGISTLGLLTVNAFNNTNSTLAIELQSAGVAGTDYDQLAVTTAATLSGILDVKLLSGFVPAVGNTFTILSAGSVSSTFSTETLPDLPSDRSWAVHYNANNVELEVVALLPVELIEFTANTKREVVTLTWKTAIEDNNRGFDVQRSFDGAQWKSIGFVEGAGYSSEEQQYKMNDFLGLDGTYYYRLRQVDWNGDYELSPVRSVVVKTTGEEIGFFEVSPNPVKNDEIRVKFASPFSQIAFYEITNLQGQMLGRGALEADNITYNIPFSAAAKGYYYLTISSGHLKQSYKILVD